MLQLLCHVNKIIFKSKNKKLEKFKNKLKVLKNKVVLKLKINKTSNKNPRKRLKIPHEFSDCLCYSLLVCLYTTLNTLYLPYSTSNKSALVL